MSQTPARPARPGSPPRAAAPTPAALGRRYRPERVVPNDELVEAIDSSDQWIRERSGIVSRRWAAPDETVTDMAEAAGRVALERAGLTPADVDAVLVATVTHPYQTPSSASLLAHRLGSTPAAALDISAACAGFCYGVSLANDMIRGGSAPARARRRRREAVRLHRPARPRRPRSSSATARAPWSSARATPRASARRSGGPTARSGTRSSTRARGSSTATPRAPSGRR